MTGTEKLAKTLEEHSAAILADTSQRLERAHWPHYELDGLGVARRRLYSLYGAVLASVRQRNPKAAVRHAERVARDRQAADYEVRELLGSFNALEEAMWDCLLVELSPSEFKVAIGFVGTVLGAAKDAMVERYVAVTTSVRASPRAEGELFKGTEGI